MRRTSRQSAARRAVQKTFMLKERKKVATIIRRWRENETNGHSFMTQSEVAISLGRCLATIGRWENGIVEPDTTTLRAMERLKPGIMRSLKP